MKTFIVGRTTISLADGLAVGPDSESASSIGACDRYEGVRTTTPGTAWVPSSAQNATSCHLRKPDKNTGVYALQVSLNQCYGKNLAEDGYFGPVTENALKQVQAKIGTTVDGLYGPFTRDLMLHAGTWGDQCLRFDGPGGS